MDKQVNLSNLGEVEVSYKYKSSLENRPKIISPEDAYNAVLQLFDKKRIALQEQFVIIFLNRANVVIGSCNLFSGSLTTCAVDIKLILAIGIKLMASGVILSHNHPTGNLTASELDISLTKRIKKALDLVDIALIDHLIVSPQDSFKSFINEGLL
jgi:DNA repair protein RadC